MIALDRARRTKQTATTSSLWAARRSDQDADLKAETLNLDEAISRHIRRVLDTTGGRIEGEQGAARLLGVNPSTLRHRMGKLGVPFGRKAGKH